MGSKDNRLLVLEDRTDYSLELVFNRKVRAEGCDDSADKRCEGYTIYYCQVCQLWNAGEKEAFDRLSKQEGLHKKIEYIMPCLAQQNTWVKHKYAMLHNRVHGMLNGGIFLFYI